MDRIEQDTLDESLSSLEMAAAGNTQFALELFAEINSQAGNLFFSPFSISSALAMAYVGARSETQVQMARTFHFSTDKDVFLESSRQLGKEIEKVHKEGHVQLATANAIWSHKRYKLEKDYLSTVKKTFGVRAKTVDFGDSQKARSRINQWVEDQTREKIRDLIAEGVLNDLTRMVLVNAIYFKGDWITPFDPNLTGQAPFHVSPEKEVEAAMMTIKGRFRAAGTRDAQILELPYAGGGLSMLIVLPREITGLAKCESDLKLENLAKWLNDLQETEVEVTLPRFKLDFPFRLDDTLRAMGLTDAFTDRADFSGMDASRELYIGAVLHKAFVAVNEQGTEAAAATAVVMQTKMMAFPPVVFRADHPFLFLIREHATGSILFIGRMYDPS